MDRYKVLIQRGDNLLSPYQEHEYEIGRWYEEPRLGDPGKNGCVRGLYATPIEGLVYTGMYRDDSVVVRCEVDGRSAGDSPLKECHERMRVVEIVPEAEVRRLAREAHDRLGWLLEEALYPVDPRKVDHGSVRLDDLRLLRQWSSVWASVRASVGTSVGISVRVSVRDSVWASVRTSVGTSVLNSVRASVGTSVLNSVRASVRDSVRTSVRDSVRASVGISVWASVRDSVGTSVEASVRDSVWAYIGSLFPAPDEYPFQCSADLWRSGLVPSYASEAWRLHAGQDMDVVWEGTMDDMEREIREAEEGK